MNDHPKLSEYATPHPPIKTIDLVKYADSISAVNHIYIMHSGIIAVVGENLPAWKYKKIFEIILSKEED